MNAPVAHVNPPSNPTAAPTAADADATPRASLRRVATGTFLLRATNLGLTFLTGLLLARLLGAAGYGAFAYAISWVTLLVIPAQLGFNKLLVRELAACLAREDWAHMRGLIRLADGLVLAVAVLAAAAAVGVSYLVPARAADPQMLACFRLAMALLPLMAILQIKRATLEGLHRVRTGQIPEMLVQPVLLLAGVALAWAWLGGALTAVAALTAALVAVAVAAIVAVVTTHRAIPDPARTQPSAYHTRAWLKSAAPMLSVGAMAIISNRTDIIMLGLLRGAEEAGIYTIATRLVMLMPFAMMTLNATIAPEISRLHAQANHRQLQKLLTRTVRLAFLPAAGLAALYLLAGRPILGLFGPAFTVGYAALAILTVAQLVNVAAGSVGNALTMTGCERDTARILAASTGLNVALNVALIPFLGLVGAALASLASFITWNLLMVHRLHRRLHLNPTLLALNAPER